MRKKMTALIMLDGFGLNPAHEGSAICTAGRLVDIIPTLLHGMGLPIPAEMTGKRLIS